MFILAAGGLGISSAVERSRRVAEAPIKIIVLDSVTRQHRFVGGGINIQYSFEANGRTWEFFAFRAWSIETINDAKACYEPENPNNQSLVERDESCG